MQIEEPLKNKKECILDNPSRVLMNQMNLIDFNTENQRYQVVCPHRKMGIVFIRDTRKEDPEVYTNDLPEAKHLIPPKDFVFDG